MLVPALERVVGRWYVVAASGILGGTLGLIYSLSQPPLYDSYAVLSVALNFDQTQPLGQYDEDLALGKVASVVSANALWELSLTEAGILNHAAGGSPEYTDLTVRRWLARKGTRWELTVSSYDPAFSAQAANAWAVAAQARLTEARLHAFAAKNLQVQLDQVLPVIAELQSGSGNDAQGQEEIERLEELADRLQASFQEELGAAQGVVSFASFDLTEEAIPPSSPEVRGRGQLVLVGSTLGMLLGIVIVAAIKPIARGDSYP